MKNHTKPNLRRSKGVTNNEFLEGCRLLYHAAQQEILNCRKRRLCVLREIEICFQISSKFWAGLRNEIIHYEFVEKEEEIEFFKSIKPLFIGDVEYFGLQYHAQLYKQAVTNEEDVLKFWQREVQREEKFKNEHRRFYEYYKTGDIRSDNKYFTRHANKFEDILTTNKYDMDERATTSHDHLVASILALEKYTVFVQGELKQ